MKDARARRLALAAKLTGSNVYTGSQTATMADAGKLAVFNSSTTVSYTIPPNSAVSFPLGVELPVLQYGGGSLSIVAGAGVTIRSVSGLTLSGQYSAGAVQKIGADEWIFYGDIKVPTALLAGNNLAELTSIPTAQANLGMGSAAGLAFDADPALAANSDALLATQKAVKAYVDSHTATGPSLDLDGGDATGPSTINIDVDGGTA